MDYVALHTELLNPRYAEALKATEAWRVADMLNAPGLDTVPVGTVPTVMAMAYLDASDIPAAAYPYLTMLAALGTLQLHDPALVSAANPDGDTAITTSLKRFFPDKTINGQTLRRMLRRPASRAEVLFGEPVTAGMVGRAWWPAMPTPIAPEARPATRARRG